jgi:hypothetical protein
VSTEKGTFVSTEKGTFVSTEKGTFVSTEKEIVDFLLKYYMLNVNIGQS